MTVMPGGTGCRDVSPHAIRSAVMRGGHRAGAVSDLIVNEHGVVGSFIVPLL